MTSSAACGFVNSGQTTPTANVEQPKSPVPFRTREPDEFQCEIIETAGETVRRKRLAKKGTWRRIDFDRGEKTHRALLQTDSSFVIDIGRGVYAENTPGSGGQFSDLTHELLTTGPHADFEETAREGSRVSYVVRPANSPASEIVVHYDESIGLPVKQEYFSIFNGERTLQFTVEIVDFKPGADAALFSLPAGLKKEPLNEVLNAAAR